MGIGLASQKQPDVRVDDFLTFNDNKYLLLKENSTFLNFQNTSTRNG